MVRLMRMRLRAKARERSEDDNIEKLGIWGAAALAVDGDGFWLSSLLPSDASFFSAASSVSIASSSFFNCSVFVDSFVIFALVAKECFSTTSFPASQHNSLNNKQGSGGYNTNCTFAPISPRRFDFFTGVTDKMRTRIDGLWVVEFLLFLMSNVLNFSMPFVTVSTDGFVLPPAAVLSSTNLPLSSDFAATSSSSSSAAALLSLAFFFFILICSN
mmetsp:Transcript_31583/g.47571  ORF Transcript_31583/g.47571 Transcript_31583/m.47571 type:complete len:215 (+) Transcript_31583:3655-4299(+)